MSAEIIQFVPRPNPNRDALDRINGVPANVEAPSVGGNPNVPYGGQGIDGMVFTAPDTDSA